MKHIEYIFNTYRYDAERGRVVRKSNGNVYDAKTIKSDTLIYRQIPVGNGSRMVEHKVVMILTGKYIVGKVIDHLDGNGLNNLIDNLKMKTQSQNCQNRKDHSNNTSGVKGVSFHKKYERWQASITNLEGKRMNKMFDSLAEAILWRKTKEFKFGYTTR
jgi:hypothetical protein